MNDMAAYYTPDPEIGLFGGRWEHDPATHVLRWVQERQPAPMPKMKNIPKVVKCGWCATDFIRTRERVIYCSDKCKHDGRKKNHREFEAERRKSQKVCVDCGAPVVTRRAKSMRCKPCAVGARDSEGKWVAA